MSELRTILVIDDDQKLCALIKDYLGPLGFDVTSRHTGPEGLEEAVEGNYEAVILDVMLPGMDGFEVLRELRKKSTVPVLMLTAMGEETDRIVGLELGADDYLPKPFNPRELLARLRAILRRQSAPADESGKSMRFGRLEIDRSARVVRVAGEERPLTSHQFQLLCILAESAGRVLSRDQLMDRLRGESIEAFDRSIDVHISRIRSAIEHDPKRPRRIITVRGAGYVFARSQDDEGPS